MFEHLTTGMSENHLRYQNYICPYLPAVKVASKISFESRESSEAKYSWEAFRSLSLTGRSSREKIPENHGGQ
jgi:hypothetical protein